MRQKSETNRINTNNQKFQLVIGTNTMCDLITNREKYLSTQNLRLLGTKRLRPPENPLFSVQAYGCWNNPVS